MKYKPSLVTTKAVYDFTGELVELKAYLYRGPVAWCGGPDSQMKQIADEQKGFFNTMTANYNQMFAGQNAILDSLKSSWAPVLAAGINQYGFSKAEDTALRSQATDTTALQYANAAKAVNNSFAARGGGDAVLPSGTESQIAASVAEAAANQLSQEQLGITTAGYETGRSNYMAAASALSNVAGMYNPTAYANADIAAGNSAYSSAHTNYQIGQQTGWGGMLGGVLGGVAGSFLGPIGASLGAGIGGKIGGLFGGSASGGGGGLVSGGAGGDFGDF